MQYVCRRQLTAGGMTYYPGMVIPDGVILPARGEKLLKCGYLTRLEERQPPEAKKDTHMDKAEKMKKGQTKEPFVTEKQVDEKKGADA